MGDKLPTSKKYKYIYMRMSHEKEPFLITFYLYCLINRDSYNGLF